MNFITFHHFSPTFKDFFNEKISRQIFMKYCVYYCSYPERIFRLSFEKCFCLQRTSKQSLKKCSEFSFKFWQSSNDTLQILIGPLALLCYHYFHLFDNSQFHRLILNVWFQKISIPSPRRFFSSLTPPPPSRFSISEGFTLLPPPPGISMIFPLGPP